jgi:hypothetical protein
MSNKNVMTPGGGRAAWGAMDAATDLLIYSYNLTRNLSRIFRLSVVSREYRFLSRSKHHLIIQSSEYDITTFGTAFGITDI